MRLEKSEENGIRAIRPSDKKIYSVGISTFGNAELAMLAGAPNRAIIATTIDYMGLLATKEKISSLPTKAQLTIIYEDVSQPLPYEDNYFDFIYARLVLHYLSKKSLETTLEELYRVLVPGGRFYSVVRSTKERELQQDGVVYDAATDMITHPIMTTSGPSTCTRRFFSPTTLRESFSFAGYKVLCVEEYEEVLYKDFMRTVPNSFSNVLVSALVEK